jgi:hypothetical protein
MNNSAEPSTTPQKCDLKALKQRMGWTPVSDGEVAQGFPIAPVRIDALETAGVLRRHRDYGPAHRSGFATVNYELLAPYTWDDALCIDRLLSGAVP